MRVILIFTTLLIGSLIAKDGKLLYNKHGCYGCHGIDGVASGSYPTIAQKPKEYIIKKLNQYKNHQIKTSRSDIMNPFAKALSDSEIESISNYLSNIKVDRDRERYELGFEPWDGGGS